MTEKKILTKIAYYYYKLELTQNEIAQRLGMSRQRVNRLLKRCRDEGVVEIRITGFDESHIELEGLLESRYGLKQVVVTPEAEDEQLYEVLGTAAAGLARAVGRLLAEEARMRGRGARGGVYGITASSSSLEEA